MKNVDFNSLTNSELVEKLAALKTELFNLRFTHATGSLTNSSELAICKRNIARVKTVIRQRELGLAQAPEKEAVKKSTKKAAKVDAEVKG
jgi:large subunit ribosomal protein L29